ncbi:MAG: hypothetical protein HC771_20400 [Synechococcales cyanobacterium CRU_2_2]|nr:hypothetical protein [Synechococcales cyanobacterium CRU_2_2]
MTSHKLTAALATKSISLAIGLVCLSWANIASAAPLPDISGSWKIIGNQSDGVLEIKQAPSPLACKPISGKLFGFSQIVGYYCPATGRLAFIRQDNERPAANQMWVGNLSAVVQGQPNRMGGTFHAVNAGAGSGELGEYNFQGVK